MYMSVLEEFRLKFGKKLFMQLFLLTDYGLLTFFLVTQIHFEYTRVHEYVIVVSQ